MIAFLTSNIYPDVIECVIYTDLIRRYRIERYKMHTGNIHHLKSILPTKSVISKFYGTGYDFIYFNPRSLR